MSEKKGASEILNALTAKYLPDIIDPLFRSYDCNDGRHERCGTLFGIKMGNERDYCQCQCHKDME